VHTEVNKVLAGFALSASASAVNWRLRSPRRPLGHSEWH